MKSCDPPLIAETCIGYMLVWSKAQVLKAKPICCNRQVHPIRWALCFARINAGTSSIAKMEITARIINNSVKVNALFRSLRCLVIMAPRC